MLTFKEFLSEQNGAKVSDESGDIKALKKIKDALRSGKKVYFDTGIFGDRYYIVAVGKYKNLKGRHKFYFEEPDELPADEDNVVLFDGITPSGSNWAEVDNYLSDYGDNIQIK